MRVFLPRIQDMSSMFRRMLGGITKAEVTEVELAEIASEEGTRPGSKRGRWIDPFKEVGHVSSFAPLLDRHNRLASSERSSLEIFLSRGYRLDGFGKRFR